MSARDTVGREQLRRCADRVPASRMTGQPHDGAAPARLTPPCASRPLSVSLDTSPTLAEPPRGRTLRSELGQAGSGETCFVFSAFLCLVCMYGKGYCLW